jgi:hypothetical protein
MRIPRYCRRDIQTNNVASIWLLDGNAGAHAAGDRDSGATTQFCSKPLQLFAVKCPLTAMGCVVPRQVPVQASLKSD